jgi:hypothetical protein
LHFAGTATAGIRQLELDAYPDPQGNLFRTSAGRKLAGENGFLQIPALARPGWKVKRTRVFGRRLLSRSHTKACCRQEGPLQVRVLSRSGWMFCRPTQVLHVPDIDFNSTVWTFMEGLQAIKVR